MKRILMLDVEALSLKPSAVILQIGARILELESAQTVFEHCFWPDLAEQEGRTTDIDTAVWWMQQSQGAVAAALQGHTLTKTTPREAIFKQLLQWLQPGDWGFNIGSVWAKPASFDLVMLTDYFNGNKPWGFRQERCLQTVARLLDPEGAVRPPKDEAQAHDARYDVAWQCLYLSNLHTLKPELEGWTG